jgi:hypothetical protein
MLSGWCDSYYIIRSNPSSQAASAKGAAAMQGAGSGSVASVLPGRLGARQPEGLKGCYCCSICWTLQSCPLTAHQGGLTAAEAAEARPCPGQQTVVFFAFNFNFFSFHVLRLEILGRAERSPTSTTASTLSPETEYKNGNLIVHWNMQSFIAENSQKAFKLFE